MVNLAVRVGSNSVALWAAAALVSGIELASGVGPVLLVTIVFGLVNALLKPVAKLLSLPVLILTLGLFTLVVNGAMLAVTAWLTDSLDIDGFGSAVLGAIVISLVSWALSVFLQDDDD